MLLHFKIGSKVGASVGFELVETGGVGALVGLDVGVAVGSLVGLDVVGSLVEDSGEGRQSGGT